jgi:Protein of unknown function (DUF3313)
VKHPLFSIPVAGLLLFVAHPTGAKPPATWDGLVQVPSKRLDLVYLQPGADFSRYTKVLLEPTEVAFHKDWRRDYNSSTRSLSSKVSDRELEEAIAQAVVAANDIFAKAMTKGGYALATAAGPDVLKVRTGIVNIHVSAPDRPTASRSYSFAGEAGSATLFVEARDSLTGALLGRAVDQRIAGDNNSAWRTSVSNRGDFRDLVETWASASVRGLTELKSKSPINP